MASETHKPKPPVEGQILYSVPQAAQVLGVGGRFCWSLVLSGQLESRVLGKRRLIHRKELERFATRPTIARSERRSGDDAARLGLPGASTQISPR